MAMDQTPRRLAPCGRSTVAITVGAVERSFVLSIPQSLCPSSSLRGPNAKLESVPLVVAIHCFGCEPEHILAITEQAADRYGFVLAAPVGYERSFNAGPCCGAARDEGLDDVGFITGVIDKLSGSDITQGVHLSRRAVYVMGFSNGGYMASLLAERLPALRGFAALAGHVYDIPVNVTPRAVSMHFIRDDNMVHYAGCCASEGCCCGIEWPTCVSTETIFQSWMQINKCSGTSTMASHQGVDCTVGTGCERPTQLCSYATGYGLRHQTWSRNFEDQSFLGAFFAQDVCQIGGVWNPSQLGKPAECECRRDYDGRHCLNLAGASQENLAGSFQAQPKSSVDEVAPDQPHSPSDLPHWPLPYLLGGVMCFLFLATVIAIAWFRRRSMSALHSSHSQDGDPVPATKLGTPRKISELEVTQRSQSVKGAYDRISSRLDD